MSETQENTAEDQAAKPIGTTAHGAEIPSSGKLAGHLNNFDLIRLFAALQVAIIHIFEHIGVGDSVLIVCLSFVPGELHPILTGHRA